MKIDMFQQGHISPNKGKKVSSQRVKILRAQVLKIGKATRFKKGHRSWNKGKECIYLKGNTWGFKNGHIPWNKGKSWSTKMKKKLSLAHLGQKSWNKGKKYPEFSGKNHPHWKGNFVGYGALHDWVARKLGKPSKCERCKTKIAKKYEWANKSGRYLRKINDWIRLCNSCHKLDPIKMHKRFKN